MTDALEKKLSEIREDMRDNKQKETMLSLSISELSMIIMGLKMSIAFDDILDEEIALKHSRAMKNKLDRKN